jgi:hypothetical protein
MSIIDPTMNRHGLPKQGGPGQTGTLIDDSGRFSRLKADFQKQLKSLADEFFQKYHKPLVLTDTVRTNAEQAAAHRAKPHLALPAGSPYAMHPRGLAADVDIKESRLLTPEMLDRHQLHRPALSKGETWHLEPFSTAYDDYEEEEAKPALASFHPQPGKAGSSRVIQAVADFRRQSGRPEMASAGSDARTQAEGRKLQKTAVEMESVLLEQLLGQMRRSMVDPVHKNSEKLKGYQAMADQHLARALAAGGGIGLASRLVKDLANVNTHPHTEKGHERSSPDAGKSGTSPGTGSV